MSRDRSSSIMAKVQTDHTEFFAVGSAYPDPIDTIAIRGFFIADPYYNKAVPQEFVKQLCRNAHFAQTPRFRKANGGWIIRAKFVSNDAVNRLHKNCVFTVRSGNNDEISKQYHAKTATLKEVERKQNLLQRVIEADENLFEGEIGKIYSIRSDEVSVYYAISNENVIYVVFRRRQMKENGRVIQDHDPFWSFYAIENGEFSIQELKDSDSNDKGAKVTLERMLGKEYFDQKGESLSDYRDEHYQKAVTAFHKPIVPSSPARNVVKESADLSKLGKNCQPTQIQAFRFAKTLGDNSSDPKEREFWSKVTIVDKMEEKYKERCTKSSNGFGRRGRKKPKDLLAHLQMNNEDLPEMSSRN